MRIAVIGTSGSGKSTLAERLAGALGVPFIELDAINWQPGWVALQTKDRAEFVRRVEAAVAQEAWAFAGNYSSVRDIVWARATNLVWLDYPRAVVMARVIRRSIARAAGGKELWPGTGNRETWRMWLSPEHPIRWAWSTYHRRRREYAKRIGDPKWAHLKVHRLTHPRQADELVRELAQSFPPLKRREGRLPR
ncbi:AAA family ATPase [Phenylobacterium sp.]|jgi:adenylate kinase family enzyme|uniref:AAA family ATPase n=1 Tax=Phenylobacterium sp. TaxID=1871053 RepID=UPI002E30B749|nr:AAA family ATPase [Phenylobacterium sp.]HEX2561394.1 AAA family ATPase [Phenylobacterium sp.]